MFKNKAIFCCILSSFLLVACSSSNQNLNHSKPKSTNVSNHINYTNNSLLEKKIEKQFKNWKNVSYRIGGESKRGIDCSAFVKNFYDKNFNYQLPRTTLGQIKLGKKIVKKSELKAGDLVFFKTNRGPNGKHVGVYYKNGLFLHVSTSNGVTYSLLNDNSYWAKKYLFAKRIIT